jgi:hypothetical protein
MLKQMGVGLAVAALWAAPAMAQDSTYGGDSIAGLPDYYVVQPGDTLWEIAQKFLGDAYYWPRLWSVNEQITNPHWIYPGNYIYFRMGTEIGPPEWEIGDDPYDPISEVVIEETTYECGPDVRFNNEWDSDIYDVTGFLASRRDVEVWGKVHRARAGATYLAETDLLYLKIDDPDAFECGDTVSIFRRVKKKVRHPENPRNRLGDMYTVVGDAQVVHRYGDYVSAIVRDSITEVQRGDLVGPSTPLHIEVDVRNPDGDLQGTIVERLNYEYNLGATREVVFIDRGRADGVRRGNSFYIIQQRDDFIGKEDTNLPPSVVGRVVVLSVDEYVSTAVVTDANRSIKIGDRLTQEVD